MLKKLRDRKWRLNNLYYVTDKTGRTVKFRMTAEQLHFYGNMHNRNIILKARQLGFTTEVCIIQLDSAIFESTACAMIAHTKPDAQRLFRNKTRFAYDRLPDIIKQANPLVVENTDEFVFSKGGSVTISTSFRGGTLQKLHVSEFGKICAKSPEKAREIVSGAFEAVPLSGDITLESTAEGRHGYFFDYCKEAENLARMCKELNSQEWKFFFFAWWQNPEYTMPEQEIPSRLEQYFTKLEKQHGITLTGGQKTWYMLKERTLGEYMKREYPSTSSEAFEQSIEGAYYANQFSVLYAKGMIGELPDNSHQPVMTFWDLGVSDSTAIWFVREVGNQWHIIDYYENSGEGLDHYLSVLKQNGYTYSKHVAPHDIDNRQMGSQHAQSLRSLARKGYDVNGERLSISFEVVPRTTNINNDIEQVRAILPHCCFDSVKCFDGIKTLENYRKEWNDKLGVWRDNPLHDWSSHGADAFRYFAVYVQQAKPLTDINVSMYA